MVFVIDGSGSIGQDNFKLVQNFVKDVIGGFRIGFDQTHVGAIVFSSIDKMKIVFGLQDLYTKESLYRAIDGISYETGGKTHTGKALNITKTQILISPSDREAIPNVCIVITDGEADDEIELPAQALRNSGTNIFAVGVGEDVFKAELEKMTGDGNRVFEEDFDKLDTIINKIKESACRGK